MTNDEKLQMIQQYVDRPPITKKQMEEMTDPEDIAIFCGMAAMASQVHAIAEDGEPGDPPPTPFEAAKEMAELMRTLSPQVFFQAFDQVAKTFLEGEVR